MKNHFILLSFIALSLPAWANESFAEKHLLATAEIYLTQSPLDGDQNLKRELEECNASIRVFDRQKNALTLTQAVKYAGGITAEVKLSNGGIRIIQIAIRPSEEVLKASKAAYTARGASVTFK